MARRNRKKRLNLRRLFILFLGLIAITLGSAGCGLVYSSIKDIPKLNPGNLETGASTLIYDKDENLITQIGAKNSIPVDLNQVPEIVRSAFLAVEDPQFYRHHGISLRGIARAAWTDLTSGSIKQGGSTITQQLVKGAFLSPETTLKRKLQEVVLAVQIERHYTKDEILEMYLNNIYFGEGAYGIQAAAQTYFGKDIEQVQSLEEAALLGGLPQAPSAYSPYRAPEAALARRNIVLDSMARNNFISATQAEKAKAQKIKLSGSKPPDRQYSCPYYIDYVTELLIEKYGEAEVFKGGLRVYTALDKKIQQLAEQAMAQNSNFPASKVDANNIMQPQGAVVILDPRTGYIKALVGGRDHTQMRQWNRASQTCRQPGSAFKPIAAYGPAIEYEGLGPASVIDDIPTKYGSYEPKNVDGRFRGLITLRTALTHSVNVAAVKLLMDTVGINEAVRFASGLGIKLAPQSHGASMALGGLHTGVTPLQMAAAYGAFANQGVYIAPTAILKVEKADGIILEQTVPKHQQVMKATTAYLITDMLQSVVRSGTGTGAQIGRPAAGKTGTTDDGKDIWFVGYTPELVGAVWIGYDTPTAMPQAFGGTYPARIWREVMSKALSNVTAKDFPRPNGVITAKVDSKSGLLPGPNTPDDSLVTDFFAEGTVPSESDNVHVIYEVCAASGQTPTEYCPDRLIKTLVKLPYTVPSFVEDYQLRAPTQACTIHSTGELSGTTVNSRQPDQEKTGAKNLAGDQENSRNDQPGQEKPGRGKDR